MLKTTSRELLGATLGGIMGLIGPVLLHIQMIRAEMYPAAFGIPMAAFCVPGFFLGAVIGAAVARKLAR